jgi:hypothetical protein
MEAGQLRTPIFVFTIEMAKGAGHLPGLEFKGFFFSR